ncbi:MAG: alpha-2-macroglobulin [Desulfobacteraceae bacterium]|nr:alpha-2-macroglobulin [Desulfobacteraceae bacterium]
MSKRALKNIFVCWLSIWILFVFQDTANAKNTTENLKRPGDAVVVPDKFLRRWDPVTIFFNDDVGSQKGPEDMPEKYVTMSPAHPGAYTWLDTKTLQFRAAEPWPPLTRFTWQVQGRTVSLATLMSAPISTIPHHNSEGLEPVETITLTFPEPLDTESLARMITLELRPLPGISDGDARWLDKDDFDIKIMERNNRADKAGYVLIFHNPIPMGVKTTLHLRLSLEDRVDEAFQRIVFSTGQPFSVTHFGCAGQLYPVSRKGVSFSRDQAVRCCFCDPGLQVRFSSNPVGLGPVEARNLVRLTPSVENLSFKTVGTALSVNGNFAADTLYKFSLEPVPLKDEKGRTLQMQGASHLFVYFPSRENFLKWNVSQGIVERHGPQMLPLTGRGFERLDLRIYPINPLNRSLWPFPNKPIVVNEDERPPAPGEEPVPFTDSDTYISSRELSRQIKALGSPSISDLVTLPLRKHGSAAKFGLDIKPFLERISGKSAPGTYLVGVRRLDTSKERYWIRAQVTDLSLTTIEETQKVKFAVTSLATGVPTEGANIRIEGSLKGTWVTIFSGKTGADGTLIYEAPGHRWNKRYYVRRIVVEKNNDVLVLNPTKAPDKYANNHWTGTRKTWLQWTQNDISNRGEPHRTLCHIFTERPVYRPDHPVHIKGYIRGHDDGEFFYKTGEGFVVVDGPGDLEWRYPVNLTSVGSFYHKFDEEKLPTGEYTAWFEYNRARYGSVTFRKEAYRLPRFEVLLHSPDRVRLDDEFSVKLTASYYAGGHVADRPVRWRVTQFPYNWTPEKRKGYLYSTDARFSGQARFESTPARVKEDHTDELGGAVIGINPGIEPTAQPRRYIIEATVTGADDQTVSNTRQVLALPPFTLGVKVPRYLQKAENIEPEIIVVGSDGKLIPGQNVKVRLLQRQWHSHLQAGDFSQNAAKYVTDVVDEKIYETVITSTGEPQQVKLPISRAGVYIVELESRDKLGRTQLVSVDLFAGGDEPVTWSRPPARVFKVTQEKKKYAPGETAVLVLESPFQSARVMAVIEAADGRSNIYKWLDIRNGSASLMVPVIKQYMPRVPVHFILMRGRAGEQAGNGRPGTPDMGKPTTLAATSWIEVTPVKHRVNVKLDYPKKAQPGDEISVTIKLTDDQEQPLGGEVTLWLVDQAVLALGKEQRIDPLPDFIVSRGTHISARDTRNLALGYLPLQEQPGGDTGAKEKGNLLDKVTLRKDFKPVPYYNPVIIIKKDGTVTVRVKLPDNLTNFKLRAKVVSGPDRFGFAKGHLSVRLPVIVQPSLPRFVRPGDRFSAIAIGRIVEGEGGPGKASIRTEGLNIDGSAQQEFEWQANRPRRIEYSLTVPTPEYDKQGKLSRKSVNITIGVERTKDSARDAFLVKLPVQPDRKPVMIRQLADLTSENPIELPGITEDIRPGTLKRSLLVSGQPKLIRMAAGLDYLMQYPHGCTEQRISRARAFLAAKRFRDILYQESGEDQLELIINQTMQWIESVADNNGLVTYWPGSRGYVSLTAWVVQFMTEARAAGFQVNEKLFDTFTNSLRMSLRSDYSYYITGETYAERCWALTALADAGKLDKGYTAELARKSEYLKLESLAQVMLALIRSGESASSTLDALKLRLWEGIVIRLYQGSEIYGGLQEKASSRNALILPSETRTIAEVVRAVSKTTAEDDNRRQILVNALVTLGKDDGWGSTNANASALLALSEFLTAESGDKKDKRILTIETGNDNRQVTLDNPDTLQYVTLADPGKLRIILASADKADKDASLCVRSETAYLPAADGSMVEADSHGFVITRELLRVQKDNAPAERIKLDTPGREIKFSVSDIIEEHIELVNPKDRHYVAVAIPLVAGMEPLNPGLATAPPEAKPSGTLTLSPSYVAYMDDQMAYYYDTLPKGTYHFYFRTQAAIPGSFIQPAAYAEMMYDQAVNGNGNGAEVVIVPKAPDQKD